ncbi:polysaccharide biosynthesis tyrosine autokinase [Flavobacterium sp. J49]|uniref:GumC family protein n=1 Tax=Flavobacterium sp. J49 TaxID=2718534 RepID=UPI001594078F|nr:tyrosine-protein kinase family protein [Flavobacterium sp. J49]MBF6640000.1 polysaccharide biosynthesis tyrosine autokinase [Flavobacterium sp. J49]NIC01245.1 polysaccharide biosynthesis tyrosine autokinase [Flavobacterium sp. J49]
MENIQFESQENESPLNILNQLFRYLRFWYWFLLSALVCLLTVNYYLNHTLPVYETRANIKIIDDSKNTFVLPTTGITGFGKSKVNLDNQIEVLKSHRLLAQVSESLNLTTQYYTIGYFNNVEIWKKRPFAVNWLDSRLSMEEKNVSFEIEIVPGGYKVINSDDNEKVYSFGSVQKIEGVPYSLSLQVGTQLEKLLERKYLIRHLAQSSVVIGLSNSLKIVNSNENSDILNISLAGGNKDKSEAIINELIKQFDIDGLTDRRLVSERTIEFVNSRFKSLERELDSIETNKASYKQNNELTFIESDAATATTGKIASNNDVFQTETQIELSKLLEQTVRSDKKLNLLPTNLGVSNGNVNGLINDFNMVVLERDRLSVSAGENNPKIKILNSKLIELQKNILGSIKTYQQELQTSLSQNNYIKRTNTQKFSSIPVNEKILNSIERQRAIKESLYILLLQKREEAAVNLAITSSSLKVVDYAMTNANPIAPKKSVFYLGALFIGLFIPFLIIYIGFLLDDKLHTKEDILKLTKSKIILSEVPHINADTKLTSANDRSLLGESFRILRTNLTYIFPLQKEKKGQTLMVTSTIKGEGKTFTALNLSISFSTMNKKVLLIGADMRNPQLHNYLNVKKSEIGLQNYLHDLNVDWHTTVKKKMNGIDNLDVILSGAIPPNPAELLSNGRLETLLNEAKEEYDFVIVDTPPTLLVTDTLVISHLVDTTLYVVRADFTPKNILEFSVDLSNRGKLRNMAYVINNVGSNYKGYNYSYKYSYAYGYGYGYDDTDNGEKSIFKRFLSFFKR